MILAGFLCIFFIVQIVQLTLANIVDDGRGVVFENHPGKILSIPVQDKDVIQKSIKVKSKIDCAIFCSGQTWCRSVNWKIAPQEDGKSVCEQLSADNFTHTSNIKENVNYILLSIKNPCDGVVCQNGGSCIVENRRNSHCLCKEDYIGSRCEIQEFPISCSDLKKKKPQTTSGHHTIDPDGLEQNQPFSVYCDMTSIGGVGVTVVSHDKENSRKINNCNRCTLTVTYTSGSISQLAKLAQMSTNCEQYIYFRCTGDVAFISEGYAWWMSHDNKRQYYWGGATPGSRKCACGMTNTCLSGGKCNCRNSNAKWRTDAGYLTDRSKLPVKNVYLADTDQTHEYGYFHLGKLKCRGLASIP